MAEFCPNLSAKAVDSRLKQSLEALRRAEKNAVLWFTEVMRRKLYRDLGYSSIQQYAELELGFKRARTSQFIRLSEALRELPQLRESVANGKVSWTKAREVSAVATRKTESAWIAEAQKSTSRELERKVAITRQRVRAIRSGAAAQAELLTAGASTGGQASGAHTDLGPPPAFEPPTELPTTLAHRLSPTQFARYEALVERLRKLGAKGTSEELLLESMEIAVEVKTANRKSSREKGKGDPEEWTGEAVAQGAREHLEFPRGNSGTAEVGSGTPARHASRGAVLSKPTHQVTVWMCERCGSGKVETGRGSKELTPATLKAILCDAMVRKQGKRNRSVLPERVRRQVMERDRMRCRAAGCNRTRFLSVHHLTPRRAGGSHDLDNLVTLCEGCHQAAHRRVSLPPLRTVTDSRDDTGGAPLRTVTDSRDDSGSPPLQNAPDWRDRNGDRLGKYLGVEAMDHGWGLIAGCSRIGPLERFRLERRG